MKLIKKIVLPTIFYSCKTFTVKDEDEEVPSTGMGTMKINQALMKVVKSSTEFQQPIKHLSWSPK